MKQSKSGYRRLLLDAGQVEKQHEPPSPQAIIEARRATDAAAANPLAFAMGEPLPGRSALDKMRAKAAAGGSDDDDAPRGRQRGGAVARITPVRVPGECGHRILPLRYN